jgi:hypothetical protein
LTGFAQGWGAGASRFGALLKALHHLHNQWQLLQAIQLLLHAQIPLFIIWCDHPWALFSF